MSPHEEFLELCAVSTSGELTQEERRKLDEHLSSCASCREVLKQFQQTVNTVVPAIATELPQDEVKLDESWSPEQAETALFERLSTQKSRASSRQISNGVVEGSEPSRHRSYFPSRFDWRQMWMSYAAAILLFLALAISAYRVGIRRGVEVATNVPATQGKGSSHLEEQLSDLSHERESFRTQLDSQEKTIGDLRQQVELLKAEENDRVGKSVTAQHEQENRLTEEAASANARLTESQSKVDAEQKARSAESSRASALEAKLEELTRQLREREGSIEQQEAKLSEQQELLDHDRDIRELMGARELYIAEVYDVAKNGATQKSYGRVFFTKGKSLIFYAYDLDRQPGFKNASAFQAWGQRGTDREQALNLGIFFEDNVSKKRWILKFDDPQKLDEIDSVFVTVEPSGGSHKPSGKPFLFAYLRVNPNHP
jgi:hypothetical protein